MELFHVATMFLEFWKRQQFKLSYDWDLVNYDEEADLVRPEYEAVVTSKRINPVTLQEEPYMEQRHKYSRLALSVSTVLFWVSASLILPSNVGYA